jgi:hypothetical protein
VQAGVLLVTGRAGHVARAIRLGWMWLVGTN